MAGRNKYTPTKKQLMMKALYERARREYVSKKTLEGSAFGMRDNSKIEERRKAQEEARHAGGIGRIGYSGSNPKPRKRKK